MAVEVIGQGGPDGTTLGRATTEKISFFAVTPIVQRTNAAQATFTITIGTSQTGWGFASSDQFNDFVAQIEEIRATLVAYGLWAGS